MSAPQLEAQDRAASGRARTAELAIVVLVSLAGLGLRAAYPSRLAVEHFDEGVYASNIFFDADRGGHYPDQHLYAPPLLPFLIEMSMVAFGPSNLSAMLVNIVAGSLTVPLVWWVGRRWFGPTAGIASATLLALNDAHIFFSRTALTDVLLCFFLLAAVYLFWEVQTSGSGLALFAAGSATGLAWWTKYNGWLPLAIGLAGSVAWCIFRRQGSTGNSGESSRITSVSIALAKWGTVVLVAALAWWPWLFVLQEKGGYAAVRANHRGYYVQGLSGWCDALVQQTLKLHDIDGWPALHSIAVALLACLALNCTEARRSTWNALFENRWLVVALPIAIGFPLAVGSAPSLLCLSLAGLIWLAGQRARDSATDLTNRRTLAGWLLAAWLIGLFVSTPLYTPYPRLALPWLIAAVLGTGLLAGMAVRAPSAPEDNGAATADRRRSKVAILVAATTAVVAILEACAPRLAVTGWEPRTSIEQIAPDLVARMRVAAGSGGPATLDGFIVYCYGEPAALFQLRLAGVRWVGPVQNLGFAHPELLERTAPTFLLSGRRAALSAGFAEQFLDRKDRFRPLRVDTVRPSKLVLLDESISREGRDVPYLLELFKFQ